MKLQQKTKNNNCGKPTPKLSLTTDYESNLSSYTKTIPNYLIVVLSQKQHVSKRLHISCF